MVRYLPKVRAVRRGTKLAKSENLEAAAIILDDIEAHGGEDSSAASSGAFDIVGVSSTDVVLCQVKTRDWPGSVEMEVITDFQCPMNCRKLVHRWRPRQRLPDVKEL